MCAKPNLEETILKTLAMKPIGKIYEDPERKDSNGNNWLRLPYIPNDEPNDAEKKVGFVYIWVRCSGRCKPEQVMYVGKTGLTLRGRFNQQEQGFRPSDDESKAGRQNEQRIREVRKNGDEICVYARAAMPITVWGEALTSCELEEQALIDFLKPVWNAPRKRS